MFLKTFFFSVVVCLSVGCNQNQGTNKNENIFSAANIYLRYDGETRTLSSDIMFRNQNKPVRIEKGVKVNREYCKEKALPEYGTRYTFESKGKAPEKEYTVSVGDETDITLKMVSGEVFSLDGDISLSKGFKLKIDGDGLSKDEVLNILLEDAAGNVKTINLVGPTIGNTVDFKADQVSNMKAGAGTITFVRKWEVPPYKLKEAMIYTVTEYYVKPLGITIKN